MPGKLFIPSSSPESHEKRLFHGSSSSNKSRRPNIVYQWFQRNSTMVAVTVGTYIGRLDLKGEHWRYVH